MRSWSPTVNPGPPPCSPLKHVLECHTHTFYEHSQEWWLHHFPRQTVPVFDNLFLEETSPNIQYKPSLAQLKTTSSHPPCLSARDTKREGVVGLCGNMKLSLHSKSSFNLTVHFIGVWWTPVLVDSEEICPLPSSPKSGGGRNHHRRTEFFNPSEN